MPGLEILDFLSFSEVIEVIDIENHNFIDDPFTERLNLLFIENIVKDRKNINLNIRRLIEIIDNTPKDTFKANYIEIVFKKAIASIHSFMEDNYPDYDFF